MDTSGFIFYMFGWMDVREASSWKSTHGLVMMVLDM